jgi:HSP20 family protein
MTPTRFSPFDLQNWNPFRQLSSLRQEIDRLFDEPIASLARPQDFWLGGGWPTVDVREDRDFVTITVEVPGMKKEDIDVSFHDGVVSISGERNLEKFEEAEAHRAERFSGRFHRALTLPVKVNADKANASYRDGILVITLPKSEEAKPKQIEVRID